MNDSEVKLISKLKDGKKHPIDDNLYLHSLKSGKASWIFRYTFGKRKEMVIGAYGKAGKAISLKQAREWVADNKSNVRNGIDPKVERLKSHTSQKMTVDEVAQIWLKERKQNIKTYYIPTRVYKNEIKPFIGKHPIDVVTSRDIYDIVQRVNESGRPSVANDALDYCKQLFTTGVILNEIQNNPASALTPKHAGGTETPSSRNLSFDEIETVLQVMRDNQNKFSRDNYLAVCLLLALGVRKCELIAATWDEFDLEKGVWHVPEERTKNNSPGISIAFPEPVLVIIKEVFVRACGSEYLFPARRASQRRKYISDDTLNHALCGLFGIPTSNQKKKGIEPINLLGNAGVKYFTVHDLRRTCRSRLSQLKISSNVAEKCLNHKIKGVEGVYDQWGYFDERKEALSKLAEQLEQYWNRNKNSDSKDN